MSMTGYRRGDGRVGFRNHVLIMPLTGCAADIARRISDRVSGTTCFAHPNGCDLQGGDFILMGKILEHHCTHTNVGGVLFLTMSCAAGLSLQLPKAVGDSGRLTKTVNTQQSGGTTKMIAAGISAAEEMVKQLSAVAREETDASALVIGTKCGASDENSFTICHPVVGRACDMLIADGATVVLSEDCELVFGADQLAKRATSPEIAARIRALAPDTNAAWTKRFGHSFDDLALGGGKSREELTARSMEHASKAGTAPIDGFFEMEDIVKGPGLVILNAPNTDLENTTCLAAAGCNVTLFTTGRGTCVGSPTSITLKITATAKTAETMEENIDVSVAGVTAGTESIDSAAGRVVEAILAATESETKSEILKHHEVAIPIRGVTY